MCVCVCVCVCVQRLEDDPIPKTLFYGQSLHANLRVGYKEKVKDNLKRLGIDFIEKGSIVFEWKAWWTIFFISKCELLN